MSCSPLQLLLLLLLTSPPCVPGRTDLSLPASSSGMTDPATPPPSWSGLGSGSGDYPDPGEHVTQLNVDVVSHSDDVNLDEVFVEGISEDINAFDANPATYEREICTEWTMQGRVGENVTLTCPGPVSPSMHGPYIYIVQAFYGKRASTSGNNACKYTNGDWCTQNALNDDWIIACQASNKCEIRGDPVYLSRCDDVSDYLHVEYLCLSEPDTYQMCDPFWNGNHNVENRDKSPEGFILSPNYPSNHKRHHLCHCELRALKRDAKISVQVLDFVLENDVDSRCRWDFLEFIEPQMEDRKRLCGAKPRNFLVTGDRRLRLVFSTDDNVNSRGFWLYYYGMDDNRSPTAVEIECGELEQDSGSGSDYSQPSTTLGPVVIRSTTTTTTTPSTTTTTTTTNPMPIGSTTTKNPMPVGSTTTKNPMPVGSSTMPAIPDGGDGDTDGQQEDEGSSGSGLIYGAAAGGGAVVLIIVAVLVGVCYCRRSSSPSSSQDKAPPPPPQPRPPADNQGNQEYATLQGATMERSTSSTYTKIQMDRDGSVTYNKEEITENVYEVIPAEPHSNEYSNPSYESEIPGTRMNRDVGRLPSQYAPAPPPYTPRAEIKDTGPHSKTEQQETPVYMEPM